MKFFDYLFCSLAIKPALNISDVQIYVKKMPKLNVFYSKKNENIKKSVAKSPLHINVFFVILNFFSDEMKHENNLIVNTFFKQLYLT